MANTRSIKKMQNTTAEVKKLVQKDKQIRTEAATILRTVIAKYDISQQDICKAADLPPSHLSSLANDKRGLSFINWLKLLRGFEIDARLEIVMKTAFPDLSLSVQDLEFLIGFLKEVGRDSRAIEDFAELLRKRRQPL